MLFVLRWFIRVAFVFMFFALGGASGDGPWVFKFVAWIFFVWMVVRAAPLMWQDFKDLWFIGQKYSRSTLGKLGHKSNFYM